MSFKQNINNDPFNVMKNLYEDFCKNMKTNDLSNSPQRYITELNLINNLIEMAEKEGHNNELKALNSKKEEATQKLKDFGIEIN